MGASCHGYDNIDPTKLGVHPEAFVAEGIDGFEDCGAIALDEPYEFGAMVETEWSKTATEYITPRKMWNFRDWDVKYDHGTFYDESGLRHSEECDQANILQSEWFTHPTPPKRGRNTEEMSMNLDLKGKYRIRSVDYIPNANNNPLVLALCTALLIAAVFVAYGRTMKDYVRAKMKERGMEAMSSEVAYERVSVDDLEMYGSLQLSS